MHRFSLIAIFAVVAVAAADNSLYFGSHESGDKLIEQKQIDKGWLPLTVVDKDITLSGDGSFIVTRVEAIDLKKKETSAKVNVIAGGPGQSFVTLHFESARGHGIHFLVKVFGIRRSSRFNF